MSTYDRPALPDPATAPELFDGVLMRRVFAYFIDLAILVVLGSIAAMACFVLGFLTFGVGWLLAPIAIVMAVFGYYSSTLGSPRRATIGMSLFDIVLTPTRGQPLDGWAILIHPIVFWITVWVAWPISLVFALFTPRQQMVQDLVTGTLMLRRSPMARHWARVRA